MRTTLIAIILLTTPALSAEPIVGRASVTDGDTLEIRDTKIRLHGIDAPESGQTCKDSDGKDYRCGQAAAIALQKMIGDATITCEPRDKDAYGRTVAVCRKGTEDLNGWTVAQGHAIAFRRYAENYVQAETTAKALKRGIWAGTFQEPTDYRKAKRAGGEDTRPAPASPEGKAGCLIKSNISVKGEKIYHLPDSPAYAKTRINVAKGERWVCSPEDAEKEGWCSAAGR